MTFDHSRHEWYPTVRHDGVTFTADKVVTSSGTPRPALPVPLTEFVVHYGGAGSSWLDFGDTARELAGVEAYHAIPNDKPNEYNSSSDSAAETWEYAGPYRGAHNGVHNMRTWGHLALYGLERLDEADAAGLIAGIRRARRQLVDAGWLTWNHVVRPHSYYKQTSCPGPLATNSTWWNRIAAPLSSVEPKPDPLPPGDDMQPIAPHRNSDTRVFGGKGVVGGQDFDFSLNPSIVPANATAATLTVTVVPTGDSGWCDVRPAGTAFAKTSCVNFTDRPVANTIVVGVKDRHVTVRFTDGIHAHVIVDVLGYWT